MSDGIYVALSGAISRARHLEAVSANLANQETTAYRRIQPAFLEFLVRARPRTAGQAPDAAFPPEISVPVDQAHVVLDGGRESTKNGVLIKTGSPLDLALEGDGFFVLGAPGGTRYSRDGHFTRRSDGLLVAGDGSPVLGLKGAVKLPQEPVSVATDGSVSCQGRVIDKLRIVSFAADVRPVREGANRYLTDAAPIESKAVVHSGRLEGSNVQPISELIALIEIQRSFEALQETIRSYREMDKRAVELGKPI